MHACMHAEGPCNICTGRDTCHVHTWSLPNTIIDCDYN